MISASFVSEKGLLRLRLSVTHRPEPNSLQVDLTDGGEEWICGWTTPLASLNAGTTGHTAKRSPGTERDPSREAVLGDSLSALFSGLASRVSGRALWLELARPKGILPCLPWERWLAPLLGVPILRLPRHLFKPVRSGGAMHVAWCAGPSSEDPAARVERLSASLAGLERAGARPAFHVFADVDLEAAMGAFAAERRDAVTLYPTARCRTWLGTGDGGGPITDPWLRWMSRDLPQGIDLACFDAHGSLSRGRGGLLFSRTPLAGTSEGLRIDGDELTSFLDSTGASGLVLASPPGNPSLSALLTLADEIVEARPGPVLCHDAAEDAGGAELGQGLAFLYGDDDPPPASPRLSLYSHPDRLEGPKMAIAIDVKAAASIFRPAQASNLPPSPPSPRKILADFTLAEQIRPPARPEKPARPGFGFGMAAPKSVLPPLPEGFGLPEGGAYSVDDGDDVPEPETRPTPDPITSKSEGAPPEPPPPPRWLEASQRVLERHVAWSAETEEAVSAVGKAAQEGTEEALRFIKGLLSKTGKGDPS